MATNEKSRFEINGTSYLLHDANAVKFDRSQSLTDEQKAQALANMGIGDVFKGLLYRGEWNGQALSQFEGNGFWFVPANTLTASADLPVEYQTTKEAVYAIIDLEPSDLTTSPLKCIQYLAWLESYMSGHTVLKVYRRPNVSISGGGGVTVCEWENASAPVDTMKSIAIIVTGDTASMAVPVGGYAYIKDNTHGLAEGLYTNTSSAAFPTVGGTADSTVFTAVSGGGLNDLKNEMDKYVEVNNVSLSYDANTVVYNLGTNKHLKSLTILVEGTRPSGETYEIPLGSLLTGWYEPSTGEIKLFQTFAMNGLTGTIKIFYKE